MQVSDRIGRRLKLHDLHVLMSVVQAGSMSKAASLLNTTQSAVSRSIAELERTFAVRLLDRSRRGVEPTEYGRALLEASDLQGAERIFEDATTRYPIDPPAFLLHASAAEKQGHLGAARTSLIRYGGLTASDADFVSRAARIGSLSLRLNDPRTAVVWFERASDSSPNDLRLVASLADAQLRAGDRGAAKATIARGLEKEPRHVSLLALARRAR